MNLFNKRLILLLLLLGFITPNSNAQGNSQAVQSLSTPIDNIQWWNRFGDTLLINLIQSAIVNNSNMLNAVNNIEIAKRQMRVSQSGFYPSFSLNASYTFEKTSLGITGAELRDNIGAAYASMSWEVDLFGNIRKGVQSQRQLYYASKEDYRSMMVSVVAQLATNYSYLRTYQQNLLIARNNLKSQDGIMELTENKFNLGLVSKLDFLQSRSLYLQTKAEIPALESDIRTQINAICVLIGNFGDTLINTLSVIEPLKGVDSITVQGIPSELITRRPDILATGMQVEAQAKALGATKADWWPKFLINGLFGYGSNKFKHFTKYKNMEWQIEPTIQWSIFSGRKVAQETKIAQLKLDEQINTFNYNVLTAIQEVDGAIVAYNYSLEQLQALRLAQTQIEETFTMAIDLYNSGLSSYQSVLDTQKNLLSIQQSVNNAHSQTLIDIIQLYKALGGGW